MKKYTAPNAETLVLTATDVIAASGFDVVEGDADFNSITYSVESKYFS